MEKLCITCKIYNINVFGLDYLDCFLYTVMILLENPIKVVIIHTKTTSYIRDIYSKLHIKLDDLKPPMMRVFSWLKKKKPENVDYVLQKKKKLKKI